VNINDNPLIAIPPKEIPLRNAPLVRVITQVRFPLIASIEKREFIAPIQETLRHAYPILRQEMTHGFIFGAQGMAPAQSQVVWRFRDVEGHWRASLAPDFIALETTAYSSRTDFFERLQVALNALNEHVGPKIVDRLGVRYIDRVIGQDVTNIANLIRPEMIGILATPMAAYAQQALSESLFTIPDAGGHLLAQWGQIPPHGTVDPAAIEPVDTFSWLLDLDMFSVESRPFATEDITIEARRYAERIYTFFRWAVTDEFLRRYGGDL
jgi:uncharacterized protein (TIGR04255 family)